MSVTLAVIALAITHPGGLNAEGCHNNRKTGDYHCHRASSRARPSPTVQRATNPSSVSYRNCSEARAAGAAPVKRGGPGYAPHLDRDNDGIGCE
ncbi:excalibur calcium-binding domain-containing protein [Sphingomicrobium aestuariivivum]|nr:excalibur calcium-binding domain-containing protein [Sphingomicrobium aestuariivivum]MCJ8191973.1 excalibur calcium-binding domain-containing protein [Sphingomicrobium aestuariivivum]